MNEPESYQSSISDRHHPRRIVVITGGNGGVGLSTVRRLLDAGHDVVSVDLTGPPEEVVANPAFTYVKADVSDEAEVLRLFDEIDQMEGELTALVNCAGVSHRASIEDTTFEDWNRVFNVNLHATFLTTRAAVIRFKARGAGTVVNVASAAAVVPVASIPAYSASKAAVLMLSRQVALDNRATGVRVFAVCPTGIDTPFIARRFDASPDPVAARARYEDENGPLLTPDAIAGTIEFLLDSAPPPGPTALVY